MMTLIGSKHKFQKFLRSHLNKLHYICKNKPILMGYKMAKLNKKLLRKAKLQLSAAAKSGDEAASAILARRKNRKTEVFTDGETRKDVVTNVSWNFFPGELVCFKKNKGRHYGCPDTDCYLVIGTIDRSRRHQEEKSGHLEVTGPAGIVVVRSAHMKKL